MGRIPVLAVPWQKNSEKDVQSFIDVEKGTDTDSKQVASDIIVHIGSTDATKAGHQLKKFVEGIIAKNADSKKSDSNKNKITIILDSDVEISSEDATELDMGENTEKNTTLDLNGHTLKIPKLNFFNKNATVKDESDAKSGKIILKNTKTENVDTVIYASGSFTKTNDELKAIADKEIYGEE